MGNPPGIALPGVGGVSGGGAPYQGQSQTISLLIAESTAQKQAKIDAVARSAAPSVVTTFQFEDGEYTDSTALVFEGFLYPIKVQGNTSEANAEVKHTTQEVHLNAAATTSDVLRFENCVSVDVRNLKMSNNSASGARCIRCINSNVEDRFNYYVGSAISSGYGSFATDGGTLRSTSNYYTSNRYPIRSDDGSTINSKDNDDTGTLPAYGLMAIGGTLIKFDTNQPSGSVGAEFTNNGGEIR